MVSADRTVVNNDVPRPKSNSIPLNRIRTWIFEDEILIDMPSSLQTSSCHHLQLLTVQILTPLQELLSLRMSRPQRQACLYQPWWI